MEVLGYGNGLIGLVDPKRPTTVIKIPVEDSGWTQSVAREKVTMLHRVPRYEVAVVKTEFVEEIDVRWNQAGWNRLTSKPQEYRGWAFVQSRVERILPKLPNLNHVELEEFVNIHYHLWRHGVALRSPNELYGFFNKGYDRLGKLVCFDIGSLTIEASDIRERFRDGTYEKKSTKMTKRLKQVNQAELVEGYFRRLREMINLEAFDSQWERHLER